MSISDGVPQGFHEAAAEYYRALGNVGLSDTELEEANDTFATYLEVLGEASAPELQERASEAYGRYADAVERSWAAPDRGAQAAAAYREYVQSLREAWAAVDHETLPATALAAIAQTMTTVAWTASLCGQQTSVARADDIASALTAAQPAFVEQGE
jgi:hypothetical protein